MGSSFIYKLAVMAMVFCISISAQAVDAQRADFYKSQIQIADRQIQSLQDLIVYEEKNLIAAYKTIKGMMGSSMKFKESIGMRQLASGGAASAKPDAKDAPAKPILNNKTAMLTSVISWAEGYLFRRSTAGKLGGYAGTLVGLSDGEMTDLSDLTEFATMQAKIDVFSVFTELDNIRKTLDVSQQKLKEYRNYREQLVSRYSQAIQI